MCKFHVWELSGVFIVGFLVYTKNVTHKQNHLIVIESCILLKRILYCRTLGISRNIRLDVIVCLCRATYMLLDVSTSVRLEYQYLFAMWCCILSDWQCTFKFQVLSRNVRVEHNFLLLMRGCILLKWSLTCRILDTSSTVRLGCNCVLVMRGCILPKRSLTCRLHNSSTNVKLGQICLF